MAHARRWPKLAAANFAGCLSLVTENDPLVDALPNATFLGLRKADHFGTVKDFRFIDAALKFIDAVPA